MTVKKNDAIARGTQPPCGTLERTDEKYIPSTPPQMHQKESARKIFFSHIMIIMRVRRDEEMKKTPTTAMPASTPKSTAQLTFYLVQPISTCVRKFSSLCFQAVVLDIQQNTPSALRLTISISNLGRGTENCHNRNTQTHDKPVDLRDVNLPMDSLGGVSDSNTWKAAKCHCIPDHGECC
jgi:hypothetical protein